MDIFNILKIAIAQIFFTRASIEDIKTTEIKDIEVFVFISLLFILNIFQYFYIKEFEVLYGLFTGVFIFGGFGILLYFFGQWGLGDAFLFLSLGLLNLFNSILDIFNWILITFSIGIIFIFLYSLLFVFLTEKIRLLDTLSKISMMLSSFLLVFIFKFILFSQFINFLIVLLAFIYSSIPFLRSVKNFMIRKISIDKLKEGDVLLEFKVWRGITMDEIKRLKRKKIKYVFIKEGVRYAPTFLIVLLFLIFKKVFRISILDFFPDFFPI